MAKFVFWNLNRKDRRELLCKLAKSTDADVVIVIENASTPEDTLASLKKNVANSFYWPTATWDRFHLFSKDKRLALNEVFRGSRVSLRRLTLDAADFVFGVVHLVDKRNYDEWNQCFQAEQVVDQIRGHEDKTENTRTVLIGDFNMNPFDRAMGLAQVFNAMMTRQCVSRRRRTVQGHVYPFFYNPMWGLFGDRTLGAPGTYYHQISTQGTFGWNMLDQVLLRHEALDWFGDVKILTKAGDTSLIDRQGRPNVIDASDHLPIQLVLG